MNEYLCGQCGQSFISKAGVKEHRRLAHGIGTGSGQSTLSVYRIERTTLPGPHERKGWVWSWEVLAASPEAALAEIPDHHRNGAAVCGVEPAAFPMIIHTGLRRPPKA
jgi:hypothetical protein